MTDALYRNYRVIVLRDCVATSEFPETEEGRWSNFLAVRYFETCIGYTATAENFISASEDALLQTKASRLKLVGRKARG